MKPTSERHFKVFRDECFRLQKVWGLMDWELKVSHVELRGSFADARPSLTDRAAWIRFTKNWKDDDEALTEDSIRRTAKHEMLHVLLAPLEQLVSTRYVSENQVEEAGHAVLMRLMALL